MVIVISIRIRSNAHHVVCLALDFAKGSLGYILQNPKGPFGKIQGLSEEYLMADMLKETETASASYLPSYDP
jgi:hypothetical protein